MSELKKQVQNGNLKELRVLLETQKIPVRTNAEWKIIENELFATIAQNKKSKAVKVSFSFLPNFFSSKNTIFASLALLSLLLVLLVGNFSLISNGSITPLPFLTSSDSHFLSSSKLLAVNGDVSIEDSRSGNDITQKESVHKGQTFKTGKSSTVTVRLDNGTTFLLVENSILKIREALNKNIELFLEKGEIIASVSKRKSGTLFAVKTPNAECNIVGTIFSVAVNDKSTTLDVIEGGVIFHKNRGTSDSLLVKTGHVITLDNNTFGDLTGRNDTVKSKHLVSLLKNITTTTNPSSNEGVLDINSIPQGAKVSINGIDLGVTPLSVRKKPGKYNINFSNSGFKDLKESVIVARNDATHIMISLSPLAKIIKKKSLKEIKIEKENFKKEIAKKATESNKNFGFIFNPAFVEALVHMTIGEYDKAIAILDSLKDLPQISIPERFRIMSKITTCNKNLGDFETTLNTLLEKYNTNKNVDENSNTLWEIINIRANYLGDYADAERDIATYINTYPKSSWIEAAYEKLGEIQYLTGKHAKAVGTYQYHINFFKGASNRDRSMYTLANIIRLDIKDGNFALKWYNKLIKEYPQSQYLQNALFERAQCYELLGNTKQATREYKKYLSNYPQGYLAIFTNSKLAKLTSQ